jgi:uncharacterized protein YciI
MSAAPYSIVLYGHGPAWIEGRPTREQPLWDDHAAFIDQVQADDQIVLAGPFADWSGALQVMRGDPDSVRALCANDPWVVAGVFSEPDVRPFLIWVNEPAAPGAS